MNYIDLLPHRRPMRLLDEIDELVPGARCRARRVTRPDDFYFQGHFPGNPIVPACILVELLAQAGGIAAATSNTASPEPLQLRVAAFGPCKFPAPAGCDAVLDIDVRVVGQLGGLYKIEGDVRANGVVVASGAVTLARAQAR